MTQAPTSRFDPGDVPAQPDATAPTPAGTPAVEVQTANLPEAIDTGARVVGGQLDLVLETSVEIIAMLGDAQMPARELLQLGPGAVVQLNRQVGEPVDLILNGVRFACGHLVVVGDRLGVRIKEIFAPSETGP